MAVTSVGSGSQTAVLDAEHLLDSEETAGVYVLIVDTSNMANGDIVNFRMYTRPIPEPAGASSTLSPTPSASATPSPEIPPTLKLAYMATYAHVQTEKVKISIPIPIDTGLAVTLEQTDGTARIFPWNLLKM
jgi:hypothetical protein